MDPPSGSVSVTSGQTIAVTLQMWQDHEHVLVPQVRSASELFPGTDPDVAAGCSFRRWSSGKAWATGAFSAL